MQMTSFLHFAVILIFTYLTDASDTSIVTYFNGSIADGDRIAKPGCPNKCGNLKVPYPFGIGVEAGCSINPSFDISCNTSFNPPKAFLGADQFEVLSISNTKIHIRNRLAWNCYDEKGSPTQEVAFQMNLYETPFSISSDNKLTAVGCDDVSLLSSDNMLAEGSDYFTSSCVAICSKTQDLNNGSCSGIGCCQSSIPKGLQHVSSTMTILTDRSDIQHFNPCGYSFLAEENSYFFQVNDISDSSFVERIVDTVPIALNWEIGNETCKQIQKTGKTVCKEQSICVDSGTTLGGYRCNCSQGYQGNPYLSQGCQDIDECEFHPCHSVALCTNLQGLYNCSCPRNYFGDGTKHGTGCIFVPPERNTALYAGLFTGLGLFILLITGFWLYKILKKRSVKQQKQNFFKRNGGLLLNQQISAHDSILEKLKIFTCKELEKATDRFNESRILGSGGQGTVYKGMLSDGRIVAVKKSKQVDEHQQVEFINEVVILSQINHRNVVKLLGCCMETEVPLLVYEFIPNGTLSDLIHDDSTGFPLSWDLRLRIAVEVADALTYLHYSTSIPIYHRDLKSNNILLDEKYRAKLSDFGISRSVATDRTHLTTMVKGTFGYLDPEYFQTGKFTEKSDVYSFGVILVELLTRQRPISTSKTEEQRSLATRFLTSIEDGQVKSILDSEIIAQGIRDDHFAVANLAQKCLNLNGKKRPTIRQVAMELQSIKTCDNSSYIESNNQDTSYVETESWDIEGFSWPQIVGSAFNPRIETNRYDY
ncbi:wall-associated receptor kinase-like 8 [Andrographis paniculata]|uniref:wall-associated receptor kinase-like 8 n=1 Tax=Andrographis paniculata TaxID=175694 RepID=UPI0021E70072|nr:wall-associated receptor kinase-like 8 [Andrographis paniculata]